MNPPDETNSLNGAGKSVEATMVRSSIQHRRPFGNVSDSSHVIIGSGARVTGDISNCSVLEIHGYADGEFSAERVLIHNGGELHGRLETVDVTVCGKLAGTAVIANKLDVRETGSVSGETTYKELSVESGGSMTGSLSVANDNADNHVSGAASLMDTRNKTEQGQTTSLLHRLVPESGDNNPLPTTS